MLNMEYKEYFEYLTEKCLRGGQEGTEKCLYSLMHFSLSYLVSQCLLGFPVSISKC